MIIQVFKILEQIAVTTTITECVSESETVATRARARTKIRCNSEKGFKRDYDDAALG